MTSSRINRIDKEDARESLAAINNLFAVFKRDDICSKYFERTFREAVGITTDKQQHRNDSLMVTEDQFYDVKLNSR